ncbi:MAG TPA: alkaline phosphatase family protein [Acidimicrobiales bacterium]|nr:alkaline phosphatase family protein [Acidimicrobiales bacterium]
MEHRVRRLIAATGAAALLGGPLSAAITAQSAGATTTPPVSHVLLISVDGLHQSDLTQWIAEHPSSNLATLTGHGTQYANASTTMPSDSFPGMIAQVTGGTPKTTGVFYDDTWDRTLYAPPAQGGPSTCSGPAGTETQYAENIDTNAPSVANGQVGTRTILGETIDPAQLPQVNAGGGVCAPVYPSDFIKVNTIFGVAHNAGLYTAWSDKHPAYEILNGHGVTNAIDDLFTPEINADITPASLVDTRGNTTTFPQPSLGPTGYVGNTEAYDQIKVDAVLNEIDGHTSTGEDVGKVPAIFGMNFQTVSVGQKLVDPTQSGNPTYVPGGYEPGTLTFTPQLEGALAYVDGALGQMVSELRSQSLLSSTDIIISAKHGQSPIDPATLHKIGHAEATVLSNAGINVAQTTDDDVALIWLADQSQTKAAVKALKADQKGANTARIMKVYSGAGLAKKWGDPTMNSRTPDIIIQPLPGTIYSSSGAKVAEHGGFTPDDTHVAMLVVKGTDLVNSTGGATVANKVHTTQIAPTILAMLGLNPSDLQSVVAEHTKLLPKLGKGL